MDIDDLEELSQGGRTGFQRNPMEKLTPEEIAMIEADPRQESTEKMTDDEVRQLIDTNLSAALKSLRIIDRCTRALTAYEEAQPFLREQLRALSTRAETAEARTQELEKELAASRHHHEETRQQLLVAVSRLAELRGRNEND